MYQDFLIFPQNFEDSDFFLRFFDFSISPMLNLKRFFEIFCDFLIFLWFFEIFCDFFVIFWGAYEDFLSCEPLVENKIKYLWIDHLNIEWLLHRLLHAVDQNFSFKLLKVKEQWLIESWEGRIEIYQSIIIKSLKSVIYFIKFNTCMNFLTGSIRKMQKEIIKSRK